MAAAKLYSSNQVGVGSFFGGPFAMIYLLYKNFVVLDKRASARKTLQLGVITIILWNILNYLLSKFNYDTLFVVSALAYLPAIFVAERIVKKHQMTKMMIRSSDIYSFRSWLSVVTVVIPSALIYLVIVSMIP